MRFLSTLVLLCLSSPVLAQSVDSNCKASFDGYPPIPTCDEGTQSQACIDGAKQAYYAATMLGATSVASLNEKHCKYAKLADQATYDWWQLEASRITLQAKLELLIFLCDGGASPAHCAEADIVQAQVDQIELEQAILAGNIVSYTSIANAALGAALSAASAASSAWTSTLLACCGNN